LTKPLTIGNGVDGLSGSGRRQQEKGKKDFHEMERGEAKEAGLLVSMIAPLIAFCLPLERSALLIGTMLHMVSSERFMLLRLTLQAFNEEL
jgi:hypothetical protein